MKMQEFAAALSGLINSALLKGVRTGDMDISQVIGSIEAAKLDLVKHVQDLARQQENAPIILPRPGQRLPPG